MTTFAVLPIKRFDRAKRRLEPRLDRELRRELAAAMVGDVLECLSRVGGLDGVIVVTGEPAAQQAARAAGADAIDDARESGQSAAAMLGVARALERGAHHVLLVPGDCPAIDPAEIEALLTGAAPGPSVAVIPDRHGTGTNGLLLAPPEVMTPSFGPGSFARHVESAHRAGAVAHVERVASLGLDVDTVEDLATLDEALAERPGVAPRTRALLAQAGWSRPAG